MKILAVIIAIILIPCVYAGFSLAPWIPSKRKDLKRINKLAALKPREVLYELGCGTGTVCRYLAKKNPNSKIIGLELALPLYLWTKLKNFIFPQKNLEILWRDALKSSLDKADVIYVFGLKDNLQKKMLPKLKTLKENTRIISYGLEINGLKVKKHSQPTPKDTNIFMYTT